MNLKLLSLLVCYSCCISNLYAQFWMHSSGGQTVDEAYDVAVDSQGNSVSVGYFTGTSSFGGANLTSGGVTDAFITKLNTNGVVQWANKAGGSGADRAIAVKTDASGNVFVAGYFSGTASFGTQSVTSNGLQDVFVAKYSSVGTLQWVTSAGGANNDYCSGIAVSPSGDLYITGSFKNTATFGSLTATGNQNTTDVFTAKLSSAGVFSWVEVGTGVGNNYGVDVGTDNNGNVYVTGMFSDTITFDNTHNNNMQNVVFITKYNGSGVEQWMKVVGGATNNDVTGMKVDGSGNCFITGNFAGILTFFGVGSGAISTLTTTATQAVYLAKISNSGGVVYSKAIGSNNPIKSNGVGIDASGNAVIGGKFECALTQAQATFGYGVFNSIGYEDMFICKYTMNGSVQLFRHIGGQGTNEIHGVDIDSQGDVFVAGSYEEELIVPTNGTFNAANLSLFTPHIFNSNNGYCADASYGEFHGSTSSGNKDVWIGKCFPPTRAPLDFYQRSGSNCIRDIRPICFDAPCSSTITNCNVTLNANPNTLSGISPDFGFNWSNNVGTIINDTLATASTSGMYHLTVTADDLCYSVIDSVNVVVLPAPSDLKITDSRGINIEATSPAPIEVCMLDSVTITGFGGYVGTYSWTGPSLPVGGITDSIFTTNVAGSYEFTVQTLSGCSLSVEVEVVNVQPLDPIGLKMIVPDTVELCYGEFVIPRLVDTIANPNELEFCLPDSLFTLITIYTVNPVTAISTGCNTYGAFMPDSTANYSVTATVYRSNACGADTSVIAKDIYVIVNPSPVIPPVVLNVLGGPYLCPGGSLSLIASGGDSYEWYGPGVQSHTDSIITISQPGIYGIATIVSDTNSFGCIASEVASTSIQIVPKAQPIIIATSSLVCPNDSVGLSCSENQDLNWYGPNGPISGGNPIYVTNPGSYYCVVNDVDSCGLVSNTVIISQYTTPYLQALGDTILCTGDTTIISAQTGDNAVIEWLAPLMGDSIHQVITQPGTYTCKITACGIESFASITIHSPNLLANFQLSGPLCADSFITLTASDTTLNSYLWHPSGETTPSINISSGGDYSLFVVDGSGCDGYSDTITVQEVDLNPQVLTSGGAICPNDSVQLVASVSSGTYQWVGVNSNDSSIWVSQPGTFSIVATDSNGCVQESTPITIDHADTSAIIEVLGDTFICSDDSVQISTNYFDNGTYAWSPTGDTTYSIWVNQEGSYSVTMVDNDGCNRAAGPVYISVEQNDLQEPQISDDTLVCIGKPVTLWASGSGGNVYWYKSPEDSLIHVGDSLTVYGAVSTTYYAQVQTSVCSSALVAVTVTGENCYGYYAPNIFTPNQDGVNDFFQVLVKRPTCYTIEIYNRWGNLVHKSEIANSKWNGTMMTTGKELSDGVYFWILDFCDVDGKQEQAKGTVTLNRGYTK